ARIAEEDFTAAARKLKEDNMLPAVCGRVCPQEDQCEGLCVLGKRAEPVAIGNLERFAADYERETGQVEVPQVAGDKGAKVAIVGSGPAGLTAAAELARRGYRPTVFEALHEPGGVLLYGIPSFRLPKDIVAREVELVREMGAEIVPNFVVGKTATVLELLEEGYEAVFIGSGAGTPIFGGIEGENLNGVLSANEYLTRVNLMRGYRRDYATPVLVRDRVAVLGGGNVAMDSARTALRLGAKEVRIVYRRSVEESPARDAELAHAEEEGIRFMWLNNAAAILGDEDGWVRALRCVRMELGEPGEDGRRRPHPIEGSEFEFETDLVIVAYGNRPHPLVPQTTPGLKVTDWGTIAADEVTGETSMEGVYAGGDIVTGAATVIQAMGAGKRAAAAIDEYLTEKHDGRINHDDTTSTTKEEV
ncbi:MAG: NADPH-dependent glutamate synthase, partial [Candidatus Brocadiia bacterium]